jgi:dTDP-4-amino-4,6-dideoxygalactose transaminase
MARWRVLIAPAAPGPTPATEAAARLRVARPLLPRAEAIAPYIERIDDARYYSNFGPLVTELEQRLGERAGGASVCTIANATLGLTLLLRELTNGGGLCLMPGFTFVATAHAAAQAGLTPYFADVDEQTWMLTPARARAALERAPGQVSAIMVVAAFGAQPDIDGFLALKRETGIPIIVDAAAAFDSTLSAPLPTVVSLHATKVLGAGEGGFILGDADLMARVRAGSGFGFSGSRSAQFIATNAKMSEYTAAAALAALDGWDAARLRWMIAARKLRLACFRAPHISFQRGWSQHWVSSTCMVATPPGQAGALTAHLAAADIDTCAWWGAGLHRDAHQCGDPRRVHAWRPIRDRSERRGDRPIGRRAQCVLGRLAPSAAQRRDLFLYLEPLPLHFG